MMRERLAISDNWLVCGYYEVLGDRQLNTFRVAVVEDDQSFRESLEGLLQCVGYEVKPYVSGEDFLASGPLQDIDCLITDYGLPGMNGIDLLRAARAIRAELPIILITARPEPVIRSRALAEGAHRAFTKPINTADLLSAISAAV
jgi:FixJ family two-component response regulator